MVLLNLYNYYLLYFPAGKWIGGTVPIHLPAGSFRPRRPRYQTLSEAAGLPEDALEGAFMYRCGWPSLEE